MPFSHVFIHVDKLLTQMSQDPDGKRQALEVWLAQFAKEAIFLIFILSPIPEGTGTAVNESYVITSR